jgi:hypothetical protein
MLRPWSVGMSASGPGGGQPEQAATPLGAVKTVAWAFFGVRKRNDHEREARVNPLVVVAVGFVGVFLLVAALIVLVNWVAG